MPHALIALGSNLGDRTRTLDAAIERLDTLPGVHLLAHSNWHETPPIGGPPGQQTFLNGAATIETSLTPQALLSGLQAVEQSLLRERHERWGARTVDLDLLLYDELVLTTGTLTIPHPRMAFRQFVLAPACEIAANWRHPTTGSTLAQLLSHLQHAYPYVAIAGVSLAARQQLAEAILATLPGRLIQGSQPPASAGDMADPSGPDLPATLELLDQQASMLAWDATFRELVVSDFWLGQLLAEAAATLAPSERETFQKAWENRCLGRTVPPKLIVWLCDPPDRQAGADNVRLARLHEELASLLGRPGWGPVLKVSQNAAMSPLTEAVAAIQAMGPATA